MSYCGENDGKGTLQNLLAIKLKLYSPGREPPARAAEGSGGRQVADGGIGG